jgi:hypothetical protein
VRCRGGILPLQCVSEPSLVAAPGGTPERDALGRWQETRKGRTEKTVLVRISLSEGLDVGDDTGMSIDLNCDVPFKFSGKIEQLRSS